MDEASLPTAAPAPGQDDAPAQPTEADLQALDIYSVVAKVRKHDSDPRSSGVVKRYRKQGPSSDSASSSARAQSQHPMVPACKAPPPKPCPFALGAPRLGDPPFKVSDLPSHTGAVFSRPRFTVKYPAHKPGTPKPPPVFCKKHSIATTPPALGGKPCPDLRWVRKSVPLPAQPNFPQGQLRTCAFHKQEHHTWLPRHLSQSLAGKGRRTNFATSSKESVSTASFMPFLHPASTRRRTSSNCSQPMPSTRCIVTWQAALPLLTSCMHSNFASLLSPWL